MQTLQQPCTAPRAWNAGAPHAPIRYCACRAELSRAPNETQPDPARCPVLRVLPPSKLSRLQSLISFYSAGPTRSLDINLADKPITNDYFLGVIPQVVLGELEAAKEFLSYESKGQVVNNWPASVVSILGSESLVVTDANTHKFLRKLLSPALSLEAVEKYLPQIQTAVTDALERWVSEAEQGRTVLAAKELKTLTLRVIFSVALGREITRDELKVLQPDFTTWVAELLSVAPYDVWPFPFHEAMNARRRLAAFVQKEVDLVRASLNSGDSSVRPTSTLATLLTTRDEEGNGLTDKQVVDNILTYLSAGHDTSSSHLTCLLSQLTQHPEVLSKVREEQRRIISTHGHTITPAALRDMTYTQAVLQETFRVKPIVRGVFRSPTEDVAVAGYQVPKGSLTNVGLARLITKDPRWPSDSLSPSDPLHPSHYNPDRFLTEQGRAQGAQVPFGIGMHKCVGQYLAQTEAKVFLATLARGYTYTADDNTKWSLLPVPQPKNGLPVCFKRFA